MEWLFVRQMGRRNVGGAEHGVPRRPLARHEGQSDDQRRKSNRAVQKADLWEPGNRGDGRRSEGIRQALDSNSKAGASGGYGASGRNLPGERTIRPAYDREITQRPEPSVHPSPNP